MTKDRTEEFADDIWERIQAERNDGSLTDEQMSEALSAIIGYLLGDGE